MANKNDVQLTVRMKNEAAKAVDAITSALEKLTNVQNKVGTSAENTGGSLGKVVSEIGKLTSALDASKAFDKMAADVDQASNALKAQQAALANTEADLKSYQTQMKQATAVQTQLKAQVESGNATLKAQQAELKATQKELDGLNKKMKDGTETKYMFPTTGSQAAQEAVKVKQEYDRLTASVQANESAQGELESRLRSVNAAIKQLGGQEAAAESSIKRQTAAIGEQRSNLQGLSSAVNAAESQYQKLSAAQTASVAAMQRANAADNQAAANKRALADAMREYNDGARRSLDFTQRIRGQVLSLAAAYIGLHNAISQIGTVITSFQSLEAAQNRLGAVFQGDQSRVSQELDFLRRNADRLGISFQVLADEYGKFAVATQGTNLAGEETRKIFLAVAEAGRVNKLSMDNMQGTYLALTQMVSKGKVQSEELRRQLGDRLPGAFQIMAQALGKSTAELDEMMKKGEVTSDALSKFADELNRRFGNQLEASLTSTTTALGRFQNGLFQTRLLFANSGFIDSFTDSVNQLSEAMAGPQFQSFIQKLSQAFATLIDMLSAVAPHLDAITVFGAAFIGLKMGGYVASLAVNFRALVPQILAAKTATEILALRTANSRTAILAATVATRSWSVALGLLGGPIGIAITAITTAIGYWAVSTNTATAAMNAHQKVVDEVKNAYDRAGKGAKDWAKLIGNATRAQTITNVQTLTTEYGKLSEELDRTISKFARIANAPMGRSSEADRDTILQMSNAIEDLKARNITIDEFKKRIDNAFGATTNKALKDVALNFLNIVERQDGLRSVSERLREAELILKALTGTTEESEQAMKELAGVFDDANRPIEDGTEALENYNKAIQKLKEGIPGLANEAKKLKSLAEVDAIEKSFRDVGPITPEQNELLNRRRSAIYAESDRAIIAEAPKIAKGVIDRIIRIESTGNANARNPRSTAAGLGQFLDGTWIEQFTKVFPETAARLLEAGKKQGEAAILMYKTGEQNRDTQMKVLENFTAENQARLLNAGINPNAANTYLAHFLGPGGAIKVILANPKEQLSNLLKPEVIAANQSVLGAGGRAGGTAGGVQAWAARLMGGNATLMDNGLTQMETEAAKLAKQREDALKRINNELDEQYNKLRLTTTEAEVQNKLKEAGLTLTSAEGQALAERIRKSREQTDAEEKVNALMAQRQMIQEQIKFNQEQTGDVEVLRLLQEQLVGVNGQLNSAIQNAIKMWAAIGGPQADAAIMRLQQVGMTVNRATVGVMDWDKIITSGMNDIASKGADVFGTLAEGIWGLVDGTASWGDVLKSTGQAFMGMVAEVLMGIAKMILQQVILNGLYMIAAMFGYYGPGGQWGAGNVSILPVNHAGGIVGSNGGRHDAISFGSMGRAFKYHDGGIAGERPLADNEVMTVLEKGEEVLPENDPRHVKNGGGGIMGGQAPANVKIVNAFDAASLTSEGLTSQGGQQTFLNVIRSNKATIKSILG